MSRRIVIEEPCEHGRFEKHWVGRGSEDENGWWCFFDRRMDGGSRIVVETTPDVAELSEVLLLADNFNDGTDYHFDRLTPDEQESIVGAARWVAAVFGGTDVA